MTSNLLHDIESERSSAVESIMKSYVRRWEAARNAGGITHFEVMCGKAIPSGYWYDAMTCCWIPENVRLMW